MAPDDIPAQQADAPEEKRQPRERHWVKSLTARLCSDLAQYESKEFRVVVADGEKLPNLCQIHQYPHGGELNPEVSRYETDLLIKDQFADGHWIPRVVVECKLDISTHDALTYSAKAETHKHVHPYLRYGILIGNLQALPGRLIRHGAYFDFMLSWARAQSTDEEWKVFCQLVGEEILASRKLQELLTTNRSAGRNKITVLRRPLVVS